MIDNDSAYPLDLQPFDITVSQQIPGTVKFLRLNNSTTALAVTIERLIPGTWLIVTQIDSGTAGHTVTLPSGATWEGTNDVATLNKLGEALVCFVSTPTRVLVIENIVDDASPIAFT